MAIARNGRIRTTVSADLIARRYLDLIGKSLTNSIYGDADLHPNNRGGAFDPALRADGRDWPSAAHTMIGTLRLQNVRSCVEDVLAHGIPGDLVETGVWRGGASIMMRAVLAAFGARDRRVWLADSFCGLPPPDAQTYPDDAGDPLHTFDDLAVPLEVVRANFAAYDLLDDQVVFLPGWFRETLPNAPIERIAVLRLDGDMYESTIVALRALYPKLSPGGFVIIDDYGAIPGCARAVQDYRREIGATETIETIDWTGVFWQKARTTPREGLLKRLRRMLPSRHDARR
jgi:O-methyltransferase